MTGLIYSLFFLDTPANDTETPLQAPATMICPTSKCKVLYQLATPFATTIIPISTCLPMHGSQYCISPTSVFGKVYKLFLFPPFSSAKLGVSLPRIRTAPARSDPLTPQISVEPLQCRNFLLGTYTPTLSQKNENEREKTEGVPQGIHLPQSNPFCMFARSFAHVVTPLENASRSIWISGASPSSSRYCFSCWHG